MQSFVRITALLLLAVLTGCGGGGGADSEQTPASPGAGNPPAALASQAAMSARVTQPQLAAGNVRLALSGASGCGFDHVWVSVQAIRIDRADAAANADPVSSELTLSPPRRIDLVGLTGGLLAELGTAALPAGRYQALRLVLAANGPEGAPDAAANAVQTRGASPTPLATPAAAHSGIKVPFDFDVAPGQTADVVLGFDPCTSVVQAGNSGRYILKPVISARPRPHGFVAGPARLVNTTTAGDQIDPHIAPLGDGYVIVWTDWPAPLSSSAAVVRAQRYDAAGSRIGGELLLYHDATAGAVTGLSAGRFAIAMLAGRGGVEAVLALQFDASGAAVGSAQTVITAGMPGYPMMANADDIDALPDGGYLVTGRIANPRPPPGEGYYVRRFDASGAALGDPIAVGGTLGIWRSVSTSVLSGGGWITAFPQLFGPYAPRPFFNIQTFVSVFSGLDAPVASTTINPNPDADEWFPATAPLKDGKYVVAWSVRDFTVGTALPRVQLQLFDPSGTAAGSVVDFAPPVGIGEPQLAPLTDGGFLLAVTQAAQPESSVVTVLGQYFDATGHPSGSVFELGTARHPDSSPKILGVTWGVAATSDGGFVFASELPTGGGGDAIYERRFTPAGAL